MSNAQVDIPVLTGDLWERLKGRMSEHASKMQLGIRDIGATLLVSIIGSAISVGVFVGIQSNKLEVAKEENQKIESRVDKLEAARQDLRDHDKLVELITKFDLLDKKIEDRDKELQRQISDFIRRQDSMTAYGQGQQEGRKGR